MLQNMPPDMVASVASTLTLPRLLVLRLVARSVLSAVSDVVLARRTTVISPPEYTIRALCAFPMRLFERLAAPEACKLSLCVGDEGRSVEEDIEFVYALATTPIFARVGATMLEITNVGPNLTALSLDRLETIVRILPRLTEAWLADIKLRPSMLGALSTATTLRVIDVALEGVESKHVCSSIAPLRELRAIRVRCT